MTPDHKRDLDRALEELNEVLDLIAFKTGGKLSDTESEIFTRCTRVYNLLDRSYADSYIDERQLELDFNNDDTQLSLDFVDPEEDEEPGSVISEREFSLNYEWADTPGVTRGHKGSE